MEWIKKHASTLVLCLVFLIGVGLIAYPSVADYYNSSVIHPNSIYTFILI